MTDEAWENGLREVMTGAVGSTRVAPPPTDAILRGGRSSLRRRNGLTGSGVLGMVAAAVIVGTSFGGGATVGSAQQAGTTSTTSAQPPQAQDAAVTLGPASAKTKVVVYEDYRCPPCRDVEAGTSAYLAQEADSGKIQVEYRAVNLIDRNGQTSGSGSTAAGNAVQCAADRGDFSAYRSAVYAHQPQENLDAFTSSALLIAIARGVSGLDTPTFEKCVDDQPYAPAISNNYNRAFTTARCTGVPCISVDGQQWTGGIPEGADVGKIINAWLEQKISAA